MSKITGKKIAKIIWIIMISMVAISMLGWALSPLFG
jgi:hypothetical protein